MNVHKAIAIDRVPSVPWKNGGGTTQQLAVAPVDATASDFLWRVSLAQIDSPGDFSSFAGIDRTILVWHGDGVVLRSPAWPDHTLNNPLAPFHFRGEDAVACAMIGGQTQDLNLMVRRGLVDARVDVLSGTSRYQVRACDELILLCASGDGWLRSGGDRVRHPIRAGEFLRASQVESGAEVHSGEGSLLVAMTLCV